MQRSSSFSCLLICSIVIALLVMASCKHKNDALLFTSIPAAESGISFNNELHDNDSTYSFINEFGYMGGGVGIGDFNNDGIKDIFFAGNQVNCRLYLGKGNHQFEDITDKAGVHTNLWCTGVSIADVNQDGYDDIYVSVFGKDLKHTAKNLLFINQQNLSFKEAAEAYGLADEGFSTQAAFFDYDKDGDLDMYLANYLLNSRNTNTIYPRDRSGFSPANDRLYRNDGDSAGLGHPLFKDVSLQAGIKEDGYGLGLTICDVNNDGWPDVYVANDFLTNDELWQNNHDGTFTNRIAQSTRHQSYSSMGADAADLNNDLLPDIVTLDMLPEWNERKKTSFSFMNYERYESERNMGYEPEFMRNMLQLNQGTIHHGDTAIALFSEIGQLSGIQATDWSWSVLVADFNNDGWKDMHVTNGIGRDFINADFLEFSNDLMNAAVNREATEKAIRERLASLDHVRLPNYLYLNNHDLSFTDYSAKAGIDAPSMSNGAAYADLDNDGDLDLVVNNINSPAFLFINNTNQPSKPATAHNIRFNLQGDRLNRKGFGAKLTLFAAGGTQQLEQYPVRGYFSSVDQQLNFGLGADSKIDSLLVQWPDGKWQRLTQLAADTVYTLRYSDAVPANATAETLQQPLLKELTGDAAPGYHHEDFPFNDYTIQRLLPQKFSQLGPFITSGDVNNDGMTDMFVGAAFNYSGQLLLQQGNQAFAKQPLITGAKLEEDLATLLLDVDRDGDSDLVVTGGDVLYQSKGLYNKPRLYLNEGKGHFSLQPNAFVDSVNTVSTCIAAADYDGDGYTDLFIGGRVAKQYPMAPRSFLLHNDKGSFRDVTSVVCPELANIGMVTAAAWADIDSDRIPDLVVAGEWMPLTFFSNQQRQLVNVTTATGLTEISGMWRSIKFADMDNDGDLDMVARNLGLNCEYRASAKEPMQLVAADLDNNGSIDPLMFYYSKNEAGKRMAYPAISRGRLADQVPAIKKQFLLNKDYAQASLDDIIRGKASQSMRRFTCDETRSCYFENLGGGKFAKHPLPTAAQFAPVNAIVCTDINNDGLMDCILAGNEYQAEVMTGRYDASYGLVLLNGRNKTFTPLSPASSGLVLRGDVKDLCCIQLRNGSRLLCAAVNNDAMQVFQLQAAKR